ncbi:MAG: TRAP transporter large permease [Verrucomicrobiales bacterium]|nr:TRAP transporter large permease [Verrucomicrobiales bacterium]MCP5526489.1 TRAP transporter large permease [Verrucomicrobiales bacterium]
MSGIVVILVVSFLLMLGLNVPIAVGIALATLLAVVGAGGDAAYIVANKLANGVDSFALLAIPFFILSGLLMGRGGMAHRLMNFAAVLVGWFPGGLAYVNTLTCVLFGSVSGSAAAAVSSIGGFMIPEMNRKGYPKEFNVALTTTAATTGLIIPPSNIMIVYSVAAGSVSVAALFLAGIVPGLVVGAAIMLVCLLRSLKGDLGAGERLPVVGDTKWARVRSAAGLVGRGFLQAFLSLLLVVIVIGGILSGLFTATEAAAIAVAYSFFLAVVWYREVKPRELPGILLEAGLTTAIVMLLIGASAGMSWLLASENIPQQASQALLGLSEHPLVLLLAINALLLVVGTFMDMTPAVLIFTPIFLPVMQRIGQAWGLSEAQVAIHFGIVIITNLCIGLCTPPVGSCLFIGCSVGRTTIARLTPALLPFFLAMIAALLAITYWPELSLRVPGWFGQPKS